MKVPCHFILRQELDLQFIDFNSIFSLRAFTRRRPPQTAASLFLNETFRRLDETCKIDELENDRTNLEWGTSSQKGRSRGVRRDRDFQKLHREWGGLRSDGFARGEALLPPAGVGGGMHNPSESMSESIDKQEQPPYTFINRKRYLRAPYPRDSSGPWEDLCLPLININLR
jgi:hypothetical protein